MSNGASPTKHTSVCRLPKADGSPCEFTIADFAHRSPVIGQADERIKKFISVLGDHLSKKHPEIFGETMAIWESTFAMLLLGQFQLTDPALIQIIQVVGARLRKLVAPPSIQDADLEGAAAHLGFTMEDPKRAQVIQTLKNVRAYYEGTAQQNPAPQPESSLILP